MSDEKKLTVTETATPEETVPSAADAARKESLEDNPHYVKFRKPYLFEGNRYDGIDLSGLESLTAQDMLEGEKHLARNGVMTALPEMTMEYVCFMAVLASDKPIEFFKGLPPKDAIKVKNRITGFFYGED